MVPNINELVLTSSQVAGARSTACITVLPSRLDNALDACLLLISKTNNITPVIQLLKSEE